MALTVGMHGSIAPVVLILGAWLATPASSQERRAREPYYLSTSFSFRDVDLERLEQRLAWVGFDVPFAIEGAMTAQIQVEWPLGALATVRAYRFHGNLTADRLNIAGLELTQFSARLHYVDGVLQLEQLRYRVPAASLPESQGWFTGSGTLSVQPAGDLQLRLALDQIPIPRILALFPELDQVGAGRLSGQVTARVPSTSLSQVASWIAQGHVELDGVRAFELPAVTAATDFELRSGTLLVRNLTGQTQEARVSGGGQATLAQPFAYDAQVRLQLPDARLLSEFEPHLELPIDLTGAIAATGRITGDLAGDRTAARGQIQGQQIDAGGLHLEQVRLDYESDGRALAIRNVRVEAYDGQATGQFALRPDGMIVADLAWSEVATGKLLADVTPLPFALELRTGGAIQAAVPSQSLGNLQMWDARGDVRFSEAQAAGIAAGAGRAQLALAKGVLQITNLEARVQGLPAAVAGQLRIVAPFDFAATVRITNGDASSLATWRDILPWADEVRGRFSTAATLHGHVLPLDVTGTGQWTGENLFVRDIPIDRLAFRYELLPEQVRLRSVSATLLDGQVTGEADVGLGAEDIYRVEAAWRDVRTAPVWQAAQLPAAPGEGRTTGQVELHVPASALTDPIAWRGQGRIALTADQLGEWDGVQATADWQLADRRLGIRRFTATDADNSSLELTGVAQLDGAFPFTTSMVARRVDLTAWNLIPAELRRDVSLAGFASWTANLQGALRPWRVAGDGTFAGQQLALAWSLPDTGGADTPASAAQTPAGLLRTTEDTSVPANRDRLSVAAEQASFRYSISDSSLVIDDLAGHLYGGRLAGSLQWPWEETQPAQLHLDWTNLSVSQLFRVLPANRLSTFRVDGQTTGSIALDAPAAQWNDPAAWNADGKLALRGGRVLDWRGLDADVTWQLHDRRLTVSQFAMRDEDGTALQLAGNTGIDEPYPFQAKLQLQNAQLARVDALLGDRTLPFDVSGLFSMTGDVRGELATWPFEGSGSMQAEQVLAGNLLVGHAHANYVLEKHKLKLVEAVANLGEGRISGSATLPLGGAAGASTELQWQRLDLNRVADLVGEFPFQLEGEAHGRIAAQTSGPLADFSDWTFNATVEAPRILANSVSIASFAGKFAQQDAQLQVGVSGNVMDGQVRLSGKWPAGGISQAGQVTLVATGLQLAKLGDVYPDSERLRPLSGTLATRIDIQRADDGRPTGQGDVVVTDLQWGAMALASRLQGAVQASSQSVRLIDLSGPFADGRLRLTARIDLEEIQRSSFTLSLNGADAEEAFVLVLPEAASWLNGTIDLQLRGGAVGGAWTAAGTAGLSQGRISDVRVRGTRVPIRLRYDTTTGYGEFMATSASSQLAGGRVTGDLRLKWDRDIHVDADARFSNVELQTVLQDWGVSSQVGAGRITGRITLSGRRVRSANDLRGTLEATLRDTQAMSFPVFQQVQPYLAGVSGATRFEEGEIEARLDRGTLLIEELSLASSSTQLFVTGRVGLNRRLDLEATASTSRLGQNATLAQFLLNRLPVAVPTPVTWALAANSFLEDRVIHLQVGGTLISPVVRVRPLPLLRDTALRFFLQRAVQPAS